MRKPAVQWTIAIVITLASALWQRWSGPTYPLRGKATVSGQEIRTGSSERTASRGACPSSS